MPLPPPVITQIGFIVIVPFSEEFKYNFLPRINFTRYMPACGRAKAHGRSDG